MDEIKAGDVVILKALDTSHKMTVGKVEGDEAECVWFDANKQLHRDQIPVAALKVIR